MSVVAAKVYADRVTMAADSIMTKGWSKTNNNFVKINEINDMIVGGCGLSQEVSLMWHYMTTHKPASATERDILDLAVGAGEDFANAALHLGHTPKEAVKVACDLCCYVCEPIIEYSMIK